MASAKTLKLQAERAADNYYLKTGRRFKLIRRKPTGYELALFVRLLQIHALPYWGAITDPLILKIADFLDTEQAAYASR